jgi:tetratricopeptide (TPR) repeat protein
MIAFQTGRFILQLPIMGLALILISPSVILAQTTPQQRVGINSAVAIRGALDRQMATNRTFIEISPLLTEADAMRLAQELANGKPKLSAADREILKRLSETLNISEEGVSGFFRIVRQAQIVSHRIVPKLAEIAFEQRRLSAELRVVRGNKRQVALREKAKEARTLLQQARQRLTTAAGKRKNAADTRLLEAAMISADLSRISLMQLRYHQAASHFDEAYRTAPANDAEQRRAYISQRADALYRLGDHTRDNPALQLAINLFRERLGQLSRQDAPLAWATAQQDLGNALALLGERKRDTALLQEAIAAYREALKEYTFEKVPLDWAAAKRDLGAALWHLAEFESGTEPFEEAIAVCEEALRGRQRDRVPLDWAATQNLLGISQLRLGQRENSKARLAAAATAFRLTMEEWTRERMPLHWATAQSNLGVSLQNLGAQEGGTERLGEAVASFHEALKERRRDRLPLDWAATQNNLGLALLELAHREGSSARAEEAVVTYREALRSAGRTLCRSTGRPPRSISAMRFIS